MIESALPAVLRERASLQPSDPAFTFIDYEEDSDGVAQTLTWAQLYRRSLNLAIQLRSLGAVGDRTVILAPQGIEYVIAFLASLHAGFIAVPLSTPTVGAHDERVTAVLADATPTIVLTTSAFADSVASYVKADRAAVAPNIVEIDALDLDGRNGSNVGREPRPSTAYLQYTSGSTRTPAGVMVSNRNVSANYEQMTAAFFPNFGNVAPPNTTVASWLPFYHDMGLMLGVCAPILGGWHSVVMTPMAFLQRPARWMQVLASQPRGLTAAPNFAFDLAAAKTTDEDLAGLDLGDVLGIISGAERVQVATLERFAKRFARFNLPEAAIRPSYGLAEATLYVATRAPGQRAEVVEFEPEKLSAGRAHRTVGGTQLVSYGTPVSPMVRIVDPETRVELSTGSIGEIWARGENVSSGYWGKPDDDAHTFGATIVTPSAGTPDQDWLRTGDLGFISEDELFIIGRIKDLLIVRGRNHYPDDIEATVQAITGARAAAITVSEDGTEELVTVMEVKERDESAEERRDRLRAIKAEVTSAISTTHGLGLADVVLVPRGSIPLTTSGKVRRSATVDLYRRNEFARLEV